MQLSPFRTFIRRRKHNLYILHKDLGDFFQSIYARTRLFFWWHYHWWIFWKPLDARLPLNEFHPHYDEPRTMYWNLPQKTQTDFALERMRRRNLAHQRDLAR